MRACVCAQSCLILCDPMDCSLPGSVHGIFQTRILEWVAISSSRGSSWPRGWTHISCVSCIGRWILYQLSHLLVTHQSTCGLPVRSHLFILDAILWNVFGDAKKICPPLVRSECVSITQWYKSHMLWSQCNGNIDNGAENCWGDEEALK